MFEIRIESRWWLVLLIAISHVWAFAMGFALHPLAEAPASAQEATTEEAPTEEPPAEEPPAEGEAPPAEEPPAEGEAPPEGEAPEEVSDEVAAERLTSTLGLERAAIEPGNQLDDGVEEYVRFVFDNNIRELRSETAFAVRSETGASAESTTARLVYQSSTEVLAGFPDGTDLERYSTASIASDVVIGTLGRGNVDASVNLENLAEGGLTSGPDFIGSSVEQTLSQVTYVFDSTLDEASELDAANFGYRTRSGEDVEASDVVAVNETVVVVAFDDVAAEAARFFVRAGAVQDRLGQANPPGTTGNPGDTAAPELDRVARVPGATQYDFVFTQPVMPLDVSRFALYTRAGDRYDAQDWTRVAPGTVRLYVPDVSDFDGDVVVGAVDAEAVQDIANSGGVHNGVAAVEVDAPRAIAGGPKLRSGGEVDLATGQVRFRFSTSPQDDDIDPANFLALTADGNLVPAKRFIEVDGDDVVIQFAANIANAAEQFVVNDGAVRNASDRVNPGAAMNSQGNLIP